MSLNLVYLLAFFLSFVFLSLELLLALLLSVLFFSSFFAISFAFLGLSIAGVFVSVCYSHKSITDLRSKIYEYLYLLGGLLLLFVIVISHFHCVNARLEWGDIKPLELGDIYWNRLLIDTMGNSVVVGLISTIGLLCIGFVLIIFPLIFNIKTPTESNSPKILAYFAAIGLGFVFTEIAVMQTLTLLMGNPVYSFSVVLVSLLISTAVGGFSSEYLFQERYLNIKRVSLISFFILCSYFFLIPWLIQHCLPMRFFLKTGFSCLLLIAAFLYLIIFFTSSQTKSKNGERHGEKDDNFTRGFQCCPHIRIIRGRWCHQ